ncbi:hypothetical protein DEA8626_01040 [Defluviimonas aquaemixtae]|uniref:Uncharacterized protein n=1 Tax=Albidovulum aquaemixtae TaxID=1542388 RepID=A0A2R8B4I4_9RHOB|nr:hypothetical protein [Defluviimonas aquaemixtae]SPH17517.1 hypothetical protein DEA8626_01040 [Defluviimonas aquaemixtae]
MLTAHEIAITVVVSLAALSASTSILLGDSAATAPYASGTCPASAVIASYISDGYCGGSTEASVGV